MEDIEFYSRYYIKINNVTNYYYYYSKAGFVKKAFEFVKKNCIEELRLENMLNKLI